MIEQQRQPRAGVGRRDRVQVAQILRIEREDVIEAAEILATHEARRAGYDEGILLTEDGYIADGPGETSFCGKDGAIYFGSSDGYLYAVR